MSRPSIKRYASDPMAFFDDLVIVSNRGPAKFVDVMAPHQRDVLEALSPTLRALASGEEPPKLKFWLEMSKGAGKDQLLACALLYLLAFCPHKLDCQLAAGDRDQANELAKAASEILRHTSWLRTRVHEQKWRLWCPATGSEATVIPADTMGSHGARPDLVGVSELSHTQKREFVENLLDNLSKRAHGLLIILTNAGEVGSWQDQWRSIAQDDPKHWHFYQFAEPAPWIPVHELAEAERRNSRSRFRRLYHGEWSSGGDALDLDDIRSCVQEDGHFPIGAERGWSYIAAVDLSVRRDHSALIVLGYRRDSPQMKVVDMKSWEPSGSEGEIDLIDVESSVLAADRRYGLSLLTFDPYQCSLLAQRVARQGIQTHEMTFTGANCNKMASELLQVFRSRQIEIPDDEQLISDLQQLSIVERPFGMKLEPKRSIAGGHGDRAIALSIALPAVSEAMAKRPIICGTWDSQDLNTYDSPFAVAIDRFEREQELFKEESESVRERGHDHGELFRCFVARESRGQRSF